MLQCHLHLRVARPLDLIQERTPTVCDGDHNLSPIPLWPHTRDEPLLQQPIHDAGQRSGRLMGGSRQVGHLALIGTAIQVHQCVELWERQVEARFGQELCELSLSEPPDLDERSFDLLDRIGTLGIDAHRNRLVYSYNSR
jgi:hypothetical protein